VQTPSISHENTFYVPKVGIRQISLESVLTKSTGKAARKKTAILPNMVKKRANK